MSTSVAGKIRIDVLANAAQFATGMREGAKRGFGGFQDEMASFNKKFDAKKAVRERAQKEAEAWKAASAEFRGDKGGFMLQEELSDSFKRDAGLAAHVKLQSISPFGPEFRKGMARETAQSVRAIDEAKGQLKGKFAEALGELGKAGAEGSGFGGLAGTLGSVNPLAAGAAGFAGLMAERIHAHAEYVRETGRNARELGQGVEDVSRLQGAGIDIGALEHAQRSMAEGNGAYQELGLNAAVEAGKPLKEAMLDISRAMENVHNPAERVRIATELMGRAGAEAIPALDGLAQKMREVSGTKVVTAGDVASQRAADKAEAGFGDMLTKASLGLASLFNGGKIGPGIGTVALRGLTALPSAIGAFFGSKGAKAELTRQGLANYKADQDIYNADKIEAARVKTEALALAAAKWRENIAEARRPLADLDNQLVALTYGEKEAARQRFGAGLDARGLGVNTREGAALRREYDQKTAAIEELQFRKQIAEQVKAARREGNPKQELDEHMAANDKLFQDQKIGLSDYAALRMKYLRDYYREAAGLDAKQLVAELRTPAEVYQERIGWLRKAQADGVLTPELEAKAEAKDREQRRNQVVESDPIKDYKKGLADLEAAKKQLAGTDAEISDQEFDRAKKKLRQTAVDRLMGQDDEARGVSPIAAMQAGSEGVQRLLAQTILTDPKIAIAQAANAKLDAIVANTDPSRLAAILKQNAALANELD